MSKRLWNQNTSMATHVPQNSNKKKALPGASSSSYGCKEVEVLEVSSPISHQKPSSKEKDVISDQIIIDLDDDDDDDVRLIDGNAGKSAKGKGTFKKFEMVEDFSDHFYSKWQKENLSQPPKDWAKRIQKEWKILKKGLPDKIFVRAYESRMDLLRAVIVGAEGTPYHDGLYFFDVHFPSKYPNEPPEVHYCSGGLRINPNLYECGKVCLSLLGTWEGEQKEEGWVPENSTMLQVLVSIQGLILNAKPYFNEPGFEEDDEPEYEKEVLDYNEQVFTLSLKTMLYNIRRPPKHFEDFVVRHFCKHGRDILVCCKAYMDGAQVGCLVKGGVQDVDEGDKSCSQNFKNHLAELITNVVYAFSQIGAKDCREFLSIAEKATGPSDPFYSHC